MDNFRIDELFREGFAFHQKGQLTKAKERYHKVLNFDSEHFDSLHLSGLIELQNRRLLEAEVLISKALKISPDSAAAYSNYGLVLLELKRTVESIAAFDNAISINPRDFAACFNKGIALHDLNQFEEAISWYDNAIRIKPDYADAFCNRGQALFELNRFEEALTSLNTAISLEHNYSEAYFNRGNVLRKLNSSQDALKSYTQAISIRSDYADAYLNRGITLEELKRFNDALSNYDQAIALKSEFAHAFYHRGNVLKLMDRFNEALKSYDKAISIKLNFSEALNNRGITLAELGRFDEALDSFKKAITANPYFAEAYLNRGVAFQATHHFTATLQCFDKAILLKPNSSDAYEYRANRHKESGRFVEAKRDFKKFLEIEGWGSNLTQANSKFIEDLYSLDDLPASYSSEEELRNHIHKIEKKLDCLSESIDNVDLERLHPLFHRIVSRLTGFYIAYFQIDATKIMSRYSEILAQVLSIKDIEISNCQGEGKIRLGIASAHMKNHNGANWAYNWISKLPQDYDIFTYSFNPDSDDVTAKFRQLGNHKSLRFDVGSTQKVVDVIRGDKLDILMLPDVGMTPSSRILSLYRMAPVQFTAWGHPFTTGSRNIDYFLSSDLMEPDNAQLHYTETLVRLPNLALYLTRPSSRNAFRSTFNLPQQRILYGCLQSLFKYLPQYDFIFPCIAKQVPGAVFVFLEGNPPYASTIVKNRLELEFSFQGLDYRKHVQFLPRVSPDEFLGLLSKMDIVLDSIGWSGGNTSLEAIGLGKPIVTLPGAFMRGRHTYAMFKMMGLEKYVSSSIKDYISKAIELGRNASLRDEIKRETLNHNEILYEDDTFIRAFDRFLKAAFAGSIKKNDSKGEPLQLPPSSQLKI